MAIVTKKVNIIANIPIKTVTPPIYGVKKGITMTISDIMKCLTRRAIVEQVLSDGSTVRLNDKNFRYDFEAELQERKKNEAPPTGKIDNVDLIDDIDDDDDEDNATEEPEEAATVVVEHRNEDGTIETTIGVEPTEPEDRDDEENTVELEIESEDIQTEEDSNIEVTDTETDPEVISEDTIKDEKPAAKKSNSNKKKSSKKK